MINAADGSVTTDDYTAATANNFTANGTGVLTATGTR